MNKSNFVEREPTCKHELRPRKLLHARWCAFKAKPAFKRWLGPVQEAREARRERLFPAVGIVYSACSLRRFGKASVLAFVTLVSSWPLSLTRYLMASCSALRHGSTGSTSSVSCKPSKAPTIHALFDTCSDEPGETVRSRP